MFHLHSKKITFHIGAVTVSALTGVNINAVRVTNWLANKIRVLLIRRTFARHLTDIYICENHQSQKEKFREKMWGIIKIFFTEDVFRKNNRISGIPKDHSFQEMFKLCKGKEKYGIICHIWRQLTH